MCLEIAPIPKPEHEPERKDEIVKVPERMQILTWVDLLALPELCQEERLEIAKNLKQALFAGLASNLAPPVAVAAVA
jgi:hypothetical protein